MSEVRRERTQYGFIFGAMEVSCAFEHEGRTAISVKTGSREFQIVASATGRSLRVFDYGKGEMKLTPPDHGAQGAER